jgi:3-hydroxybutyryl-CoA dehydrogenase
MSSLNKLTVLGAGVLGGQIAWHSAFKGKTVVVYDISHEAIDRCHTAQEQYAGIYLSEVDGTEAKIAATRKRLTFTTELAAAVAEADLVIESVPEIPEVKAAVYRDMAPLLGPNTLIATNTSTLLPRDFAAATGRPKKFCALHFGNGIWKNNLAELMVHPGTSRETLIAMGKFSVEIGMVPIPVLKEQNGYVLNTWFAALVGAAQTLVTNGVATPETVDRTYLFSGAPVGPLGLMDMVGMKTMYDVWAHWAKTNGDAQMAANAAYIKTNFLDKGLLGVQTGKGYYTYPNPAYAQPGFIDVPDISAVTEILSPMLEGLKS